MRKFVSRVSWPVCEGGVFVAADGSWGDSDELAVVTCGGWSDDDFTVFAEWSDSTRLEFVAYLGRCDDAGLSPFSWELSGRPAAHVVRACRECLTAPVLDADLCVDCASFGRRSWER